MNKYNKSTALIVSLVMILTSILAPISSVYASAPSIKPPSIKPPSITAPSALAKVNLEAPARAQGVNYEFKDEVKRLPQNFDYELKNMTLDQFASTSADTGKATNNKPSGATPAGINLPSIGLPGGTTAQPSIGQSSNAAQSENELTLDNISGIKYPPGSKILAFPQALAPSFSPKKNEIYVDDENGNAFRILDVMDADVDGNPQYAVEIPQLTEVFKSYSIPEQTINLTTGNIAYIDPDFELSPDSGMPKNYMAKADGITVYENEYIKASIEGNKHILSFKNNVVIFQYPSKEAEKASKEEKEKAKKEKFSGDWWEKEQYSDLRGVENESAFSVAVRVKEGSNIIVEDPQFNASLDINWLTSQLDAKFSFNGKATADVTLVGDMTFNYSLEKCVYGYDVDLGKVGGKEKSNKAFIGIFLVLGLNGKIHVEVRTVTTGDAEAGFAYKSVGWGSLPYYVGPYATFRPASFDMSFTVDGEVHTTLACVPQVGVIIWGCEVGVLQVWVGFKSTARFHFDGGGGTSTDTSFSGNGSINLRAFGELVGYLFGSRYSIFYIEFPLYSGEWKIGEEASGSGGDMVREVPPYVMVKADAYTNKVEGKVAFSTAGKNAAGYQGNGAAMDSALTPYPNKAIVLEVYDKNSNLKFSRNITTDAEGKFSAQFTGTQNVFTTDKIYINVPRTMTKEQKQISAYPPVTIELDVDTTPIIEANNNKYRVVGKSAEIKPTVPFTTMDFNADTFNDIVTGWVSGDYTGPITISIDKWIDGNNIVRDLKTANVQGGVFKLDYPIDRSTDWVSIYIDFEGSKYGAGPKLRNLDALTIHTFNDFTEYEETTSSNTTVPGGLGKAGFVPNLPSSITAAQEKLDKLASKDVDGKSLIKPSKIIGTITNKGDMGWLVKQGDDFVRSGENVRNLNYFNGNVKITEIPVQSALEAMLEKYNAPKHDWLPKPQPVLFNDTTQTRQEMGFKKVKDNSPMGFTMQAYPTSAAKFVFEKPNLVAYKIEIEHEGLTAEYIYNPFVYHYEGSSQQSIEDFIGPLQKAVTLVTQEKIDSVVNPADVMNQWQGAWVTQMGKMELTQKGTAITGSIMQGTTSYIVEGTVSNGVFKGSYIAPSASGMGFGDIVSFEMDISTDGKSINFKNFAAGANLKGLKGTKAIKQ